jgi:EH domain-containing protein 1
VCRSFNDKPINENQVGPIGKVLFEQEQNDLVDDLKDIPRKACDKKVRAPQGMVIFTT